MSFGVTTTFDAKDLFSRRLSAMGRATAGFRRSAVANIAAVGGALKFVDRAVGKVVRTLRSLGPVTGLLSGAALGSGFLYAQKTGIDFEHQISRLGAVSLKTKAEIAPLIAKARELGRTTKFTATQSAEAMTILSQAGFTEKEILASTAPVLAAASAGNLEIAETADIVAKALRGMGLSATKDTGRVASVLALASSKVNATMGTLGESIAGASATAVDLGVDLEDLTAAVGLLQDSGLDASVAGSAVNTMLTKLASPTDALRKKMRGLGIEFEDAKGNALPFSDMLKNLEKGAKKSGGNMAQVAFFAELVGLRGQKAASKLAKLVASGKFTELSASLHGATNEVERMAALSLDDTKGSIDLLTSAADDLLISLNQVTGKGVRGLINSATEWITLNQEGIVTGFRDGVAWIKDAIPKAVSALQRLAKVAAPLLALWATVKVLTGAIWLMNAAASANPWALALRAVLLALGLIVAYWPEISAFFGRVWTTITSGAQIAGTAISDWFSGVWATITSGVSIAVAAVSSSFAQVWATLRSGWTIAAGALGEFFASVGVFAAGVWDTLKGWGANVASVFAFIRDVGLGIFSVFFSRLIAKTEGFSAWVDGVANAVASAFGSAVTAATAWVSAKWGALTAWVSAKWSALVVGVSEKASELSAWVSGCFQAIGNFAAGVWASIVGWFQSAVTSVVAIAATLGDLLAPVWTRVTDSVGVMVGAVKTLWSGVSDFVIGIWNNIISWIDEKIGWVLKLASKVGSAVGGAVSSGTGALATEGRTFTSAISAGDAGMLTESPWERVSNSYSESRFESNATVTIEDRTGSAKLQGKAPGVTLKKPPTGGV